MVCVRGVPGVSGTLGKANSHFDPTQTGRGPHPHVEAAVDWCSSILLALHVSIYIYKTQSLPVCLSAIEIKLEAFRYKQTYESYITFSREAKYGILISIRIVYGGATSLYLFNLY